MANIKKGSALKFEKALHRLEQIVAEMEQSEPELDKALSLFEEGVGLVKECSKQLTEAKQKIKMLTTTSGGLLEEN